MPTTETISMLLDDICDHEAQFTDREEAFVDRCVEIFERDGTLGSDKVTLLYEILENLDARGGRRSWDPRDDFEDYEDDEDNDSEDDYGDFGSDWE